MPVDSNSNDAHHHHVHGPPPRRAPSPHHARLQRFRQSPWVWRSVAGLFVLNVGLLILSSLAWSRIRFYSLPISPAVPFLTTLLPILSFLFLSHRIVLSRGQVKKLQSFQTYLLLLVFTVLDTISVVVNFTHLSGGGNVPTCALNDRWQQFWASKDAESVKRIQDGLQCCGFNTVKDRAWPWGKKIEAGECARLTERTEPCVAAWRGEEKRVAGMMLGVGVVLGIAKFVILLISNKDALFQSPPTITTTPVNGVPPKDGSHPVHHRHLIEEIPSDDEQSEHRRNGHRTRAAIENGVADERTGLLDENGEPRQTGDERNVWRE